MNLGIRQRQTEPKKNRILPIEPQKVFDWTKKPLITGLRAEIIAAFRTQRIRFDKNSINLRNRAKCEPNDNYVPQLTKRAQGG